MNFFTDLSHLVTLTMRNFIDVCSCNNSAKINVPEKNQPRWIVYSLTLYACRIETKKRPNLKEKSEKLEFSAIRNGRRLDTVPKGIDNSLVYYEYFYFY